MTLDKSQAMQMLRTMILIREFDERAIQLRVAGKIYGAVHPVRRPGGGRRRRVREPDHADRVTSTHRGHGHCIAKGADIRRMMAELFGRVDGYCKGKGGSMHIADFAVGMLGANGIVGGGLPIACGAALAAQLDGTGDVAVCFFGDGAAAEGEFHEALNIASVWKLPVVFVCENNQYAANNAVGVQHPRRRHRRARRRPTACPGVVVDGNDVLAVHAAAARGGGPGAARRRADPARVQDLSLALPRDARRAAAGDAARPTRSRRGRRATRSPGFEAHVLGQGLLSPAEIARDAREAWPPTSRRRGLRRGEPVPRPEGSARRHVRGVRGGRPCARSASRRRSTRRWPRRCGATRGSSRSATDFTGDPVKEFGPARVRFTPISEAVLTGIGLGAAGCGVSADRQLADGDVLVRGDGPGRQPGEQDPLHVRRPGRLPGDLPLLDRRRHRPRRAALAEPVLDVDAPRRAQDRPAVDAGRRQGPAEERDPRQQPGGLLRVQPARPRSTGPCPTATTWCRSAWPR